MQGISNMGSNLLYAPNKLMAPRASLALRQREDDPLSGSEARKAAARLLTSQKTAGSDMAIAERQVLAQERALLSSAAGASTNTTYTYATGPDGQRYIVGAEVSIVAPESVLDAIPGGTRTAKNAGETKALASAIPSAEQTGETRDPNADVIAELQQTEREVIAHEAAHKASAGRFGGPVTYTYTTGPDGKRYITGGSVPISTPATSDPEEALRNARQVMRAAMAPGDPSGADIAVAARAAATAASASAKMAAGRTSDTASTEPASAATRSPRAALEAYASGRSPNGLWLAPTANPSLEPERAGAEQTGFEIAA